MSSCFQSTVSKAIEKVKSLSSVSTLVSPPTYYEGGVMISYLCKTNNKNLIFNIIINFK